VSFSIRLWFFARLPIAILVGFLGITQHFSSAKTVLFYPALTVYSKETAIAEKFEAIVRLGTVNSRMKDFYDILYLAEHEEFEAQALVAAITTTFTHRSTDLNQAEFIFSEEFKTNRVLNEMWTAFLTRSGLESTIQFADIMNSLKEFLSIVFQQDMHDGRWLFNEKQWK